MRALLNPEIIDAVRAGAEARRTQAQIAKRLGVATSTVSRVAAYHRISFKNKGARVDIEEVRRLAAGMTRAEVARALGVTYRILVDRVQAAEAAGDKISFASAHRRPRMTRRLPGGWVIRLPIGEVLQGSDGFMTVKAETCVTLGEVTFCGPKAFKRFTSAHSYPSS